MILFYQPDLSAERIVLGEEESKHCTRVLRMKTGDIVHLADGLGTHATGVIADDHHKKTMIEIRTRELKEKNRRYHLHIAIAPTKNFDRMEWFIEKAVECGIDEISFIQTANSERTKINIERCQKIAVSAMKQSRQWYLPVIHEIRDFNQLLHQTNSGLKLIAWCESDPSISLASFLHRDITSITLLIGPEGDFTKEEVEDALKKQYQPVSLGQSILRTETAGLLACMAAKTIIGEKN